MEGDSIDLSLLRATVLDASPAEITANLASQRAKAAEPRPLTVPQRPEADVQRSQSPDRPPSPSQGSSIARHLLNDAQRRALQDTQKRMTAAGTQRSDRTDPLSQWAYDHTPGQSRSHITGTTGFRTVPESRTYNTGDWGHVDLDLEPDVAQGSVPEGLETQEVEDLNDLPEDREEPLTELFPQSQRFQQPKTPASTSRKRKRHGGVEDPATTPILPANPFGSSAIKAGAPMRMSQVFEATQAPSSPFANPLASDPLSSRPSPNLHNDSRPATAHAASSPLRLDERSRRAMVEPHVNWKSQTEDDSQGHDSSPAQLLDAAIVSDDDLGPATVYKRQNALRNERAKASRELRDVHKVFYPGDSGRLNRRVATSTTATTLQNTFPSAAAKDNALDLTDSEEETEHEDDDPPKYLHATQIPAEGEDFSENNKENIAQPFNEPPTGSTSPAQGELNERTSSGTTRNKTIADSQRSPSSKYRTAPDSTSNLPRSTDDDSSKIVCESQTLKVTGSSPPIASHVHSNLLEASQEARRAATHRASAPINDGSLGVQAREHSIGQGPQTCIKNNSSEYATAQAAQDSDQTPSRNGVVQTTIPETAFAKRIQLRNGTSQARRLYNQSSVHTRGSKRSSQETGVFQTAQSQPKDIANDNSSMTTPVSSQLSSGPPASQPIPLMDVGRNVKQISRESSIQIPDVLQINDPLYEEIMAKHSSPISALRKRRARENASRLLSQERPETRTAADVQVMDHDETSTMNVIDETGNEQIRSSSDVLGYQDTRSKAHKIRDDIRTSQPPTSSAVVSRGESEEGFAVNTEVSRTRRPHSTQPLRVFAYFTGSRSGFYPATCLSVAPSEPRFKVKFDDGNITSLNSNKIKPLRLQAGDLVRIDIKGLRNISFTVKHCEIGTEPTNHDGISTDNEGNSNVVVHRPVTAGASEVADEVFPISAVYLTNQAWVAFKRELQPDDLALFSANGVCTPAEGPSSPGTPNSRIRRSGVEKHTSNNARAAASSTGTGVFAQVVFVMTNIDPPSLRDEIAPRITQNGGRLLKEGFEVLFMEATDNERAPQGSRNNQLPKGSSSSLPPLTSSPRPSSLSALEPRAEYRKQSVFLLATRHCRHTKYFQALALGIPCLSIRWIEHCLSQGTLLPWQNYLLASGESSFLDGAVVSQSTVSSQLSTRYVLQELVEGRRSLLDKQRVLLLNLDDSHASQLDAHQFLALALGATQVHLAGSLDEAQDLLEEHNHRGSTHEPWTLLIGSASQLIDTTSAEASSSASTTKRRRGGSRRSDRDRELENEDVSIQLARLVEPYAGLRGVSTEFAIQSLIQGRPL